MRKLTSDSKATLHAGTDISLPVGTPLYATADGIVAIRTNRDSNGDETTNEGYGHYADLEFLDGKDKSRYAHPSSFAVENGEKVKKGDIIGYSGNTGRSCGPHLNWQLHIYFMEDRHIASNKDWFVQDNSVDPEIYMNFDLLE